jgi:hypothetical protein
VLKYLPSIPGAPRAVCASRNPAGRDYFCQVRFLWRWARNFLRRLCLLILAFRRFFNEPITILSAIRAEHGLRQLYWSKSKQLQLLAKPPLASATPSLRDERAIVKNVKAKSLKR